MKSVILIDARVKNRIPMEEHAKTQLIQALAQQGTTVVERPFYRSSETGTHLLIGRQDDPLMRRALQIANLDVQSLSLIHI